MSLAVDNLTVRFDQTTAVDDLSLFVETGEVVALVGPSGCGKSTLLRVVAGLEAADTGTIRWDDTDLSGVPPHERDVGLMFQDHALFTHRTVAENVAFGLRMRGRGSAEQTARVDELLALVGLPGFGSRSVDRLSGGEAQRVALARALAPEPRLLLLDEPLGALDRALRDELVGQLRTVLRQVGQTTIHVTHDQDEAFAIADRVAVMHNGKLLRIGTPQDVWADPQSEFVARFVGHSITTLDGERWAVRADSASFGSGPDSLGATVVDVRFRGDRSEVTCATEATTVIVLTADPPSVGESVRVQLDRSRLALITAS